MRKPAPSGVSGTELDVRREARASTSAILRKERTPLTVMRAVADAIAIAERATSDAIVRQPPPASACREGCAWCCYKSVGVSAAEVIRIARYLRETLTSPALASVRERVGSLAATRNSKKPCSLLDGDRCAVYSVRPLTCRGYNSQNAIRCERAYSTGNFTSIPFYAPQKRLATFALDGLRAGLQETKLDGELLDLTQALHLALSDPNTEADWLAGKPVFASARMPD